MESRNPRKFLVTLLIILAGVVIILGSLSRTYTDALWFASLGFLQVFLVKLYARLGLLAAVGSFTALFVWLNVWLVKRPAATNIEMLGRRLLQPAERALVDGYYRKWRWLACVIIGLLAGLMAESRWQDMLLFLKATPVGTFDPIFHKDLAFYLFKFRFWYFLANSFYILMIATTLLVALLHLYEENIRFVTSRPNVSNAAKVHLSIMFGLVLIAKGSMYWLKRYVYLFPHANVTSGATWVDVHVTIPVTLALAILAVLSGLAFIFSGKFKLMKPAVAGLILLITVSILGKSLAPQAVEKFYVAPNELQLEKPYIQYGIDFTRAAYGLDKFKTESFPAELGLTRRDLERNVDTLRNIRLWADEPALKTYNQIQEIRTYYSFPDVDSDRYQVPGHGYRQVLVAAREMNTNELPPEARTLWVNRHLTYTHGFGLCVSPVNTVRGENTGGTEGLPALWVKDIPPISIAGLEITQPRIYYGESFQTRLYEETMQSQQPAAPPLPGMTGQPGQAAQPGASAYEQPSLQRPVDTFNYLVVNTGAKEFDYPKRNGNEYTRYAGEGGVQLNSFWKRLAFAIRFTDVNLLVSGYIDKNSRLMMNRAVRARAEMAAPFLTYDADAYPVLANGEVYWMLDAYTTSVFYPYSAVYSRLFNYVRNSVKVTISAYDGKLKYYVIDQRDPITKTLQKIYPSLFTPFSQMPAGLKQHIRYPKGLFQTQASMYRIYHMTNAQEFYGREDAWEFPQQVYANDTIVMEPYYLIMKLPGSNHAEFILMLPFTPLNKPNMISWMAAHCDMPNYGKVTVYNFPKGKLVYGPMQVESRIQQKPDITEAFTLWANRNTKVIRGDLQIIPIENSIIYVEPVYIVAEDSGLPELKRVIVAYGDGLAMGDNLQDALAELFGKSQGAAKPSASGEGAQTATASSNQRVNRLAAQAANTYEAAQQALKQGDWAGYGKQMKRLRQLLQELENVTGAKGD